MEEEAAIVGVRVRDRRERQARVVQIEYGPVAVDGDPFRNARLGKGDDLVLVRQRDGDVVRAVGVICARTVVEGVLVVVGVEGGRDAELVAVGLVVECAVEEVGGTGDGVFGHEENGAAEVVGVGEGAVEDGRVERCGDVRNRAGVRAWQPELNKTGEGVGGVGGWEGEQDAFGRVVAIHDLDRFVEAALEEKPAGGVRDVLAIDDGGKGECAIMTWGVVGAKADREAVGRVQGANGGLLEFLQGRDVRQGQKLIEGIFLLLYGDVADEPRTHGQTLLERRWACGAAVRSDVEHNRRATRRFSKNGDAVWISSKEMDVLLHPFKSQTLIVKSIVRSPASRLECRSGQEAESSKLAHFSELIVTKSHRF